MDLKSFLDRTNLTKADVLRKLGRDPKSSLLSAYQSGASFPSFDMALKLLKLGMTPRELFGEEIDEILKAYYMESGNGGFPAEFLEGLKGAKDPESALNALVERKILEMKEKGQI